MDKNIDPVILCGSNSLLIYVLKLVLAKLIFTRIIFRVRPANERRRYIVKLSTLSGCIHKMTPVFASNSYLGEYHLYLYWFIVI